MYTAYLRKWGKHGFMFYYHTNHFYKKNPEIIVPGFCIFLILKLIAVVFSLERSFLGNTQVSCLLCSKFIKFHANFGQV